MPVFRTDETVQTTRQVLGRCADQLEAADRCQNGAFIAERQNGNRTIRADFDLLVGRDVDRPAATDHQIAVTVAQETVDPDLHVTTAGQSLVAIRCLRDQIALPFDSHIKIVVGRDHLTAAGINAVFAACAEDTVFDTVLRLQIDRTEIVGHVTLEPYRTGIGQIRCGDLLIFGHQPH